MHVIEEIAEALEGWDKPYFLIPDRREAVERAFDLAEAGDFILLAGKGHERYQLIRGERVPFSEREILERADALDAVFH
jgi:UDP-N-acetylmuramoyl-L-alanyl-D-glutamate--2,6-diaminopimelate ligase